MDCAKYDFDVLPKTLPRAMKPCLVASLCNVLPGMDRSASEIAIALKLVAMPLI